MRRAARRQKLPALLLAILVLTGTASAGEPTLEQGAAVEEQKSEELLFLDEPFCNLDVSDWTRYGQDEIWLAETDDPYVEMQKTLCAAIQEKSARIRIKNISGKELTAEELYQLYRNTLYNYPEETYFATSGMGYSPPSNGAYAQNAIMTIYPQYLDESAYDDEAYQAAVDAAYAACIDPDMTPLEKVVSAHDWLVANCQYDPYVSSNLGKAEADKTPYTTIDGTVYDSNRMVYTSYGAFVERNVVCQGYTLAFKVLMNRAGVPCCYVSSSSMGHAWNMVQLDGCWYHIDVTWDDPLHRSGTNIGDYAGKVRRYYLLLSDEEIDDHYDWTTEYGYVCGSTCAEKETLSTAQDVSVYLSGGKLYLARTDGNLYEYEPGSNFASGSAVISGLGGMDAAAFDGVGKTLYYIKYTYEYTNGNVVCHNRIYGVDLSTGQPQKELIVDLPAVESDPRRGIAVSASNVLAGARELCLRYDYSTVESWRIGVEETDAAMPVQLQYVDTLRYAEELNGRTIVVKEADEGPEESYGIYLACYGERGNLVKLTGLEKPDSALTSGELIMEIPVDAVPEGIASAKIFVVSESGRPYSAAMELESRS